MARLSWLCRWRWCASPAFDGELKKKFYCCRIVAFWCWKAVEADGGCGCLPPLTFQGFQALKQLGLTYSRVCCPNYLWQGLYFAKRSLQSGGTFLAVAGWNFLLQNKACTRSFSMNHLSQDEALQSREPVGWNASKLRIIRDLCIVWPRIAIVKSSLNQDWELTKLAFYS